MLKRDELEVGDLDEGPDHPVLSEGGRVCRGELVLGAAALEHGHGRQEEAHVGGREEQLVGGHAGQDGAVGRLQLDALQRLEPRRRGGAEDDCRGEFVRPCPYGVLHVGTEPIVANGRVLRAWASLTTTVTSHASSAIPLVLLPALALDNLLRHGVARRKEDLQCIQTRQLLVFHVACLISATYAGFRRKGLKRSQKGDTALWRRKGWLRIDRGSHTAVVMLWVSSGR